MLGGAANEVQAYKVTYHILTLPMDHTKGNTLAAVDGKRVEAVRTIVDDGNTVELPSNFKSPLAKNFTYYASTAITSDAATKIYANNNTKYILYSINVGATPLEERSAITSDCDIYVTYEYNEDNTIAKLDGSKAYNITLGDGFLAYNRGRNNRPAVIPKQYVSAEQLISEDFIYVDVSKVTGNTITAYYPTAQNPREKTESQFYFQFKYLGEDPYNITICAAFPDTYNGWYAEKEKYDAAFVRKYYKGATLFGQTTSTMFVSSEFDKKYTTAYNNANETLVETTEFPGFYRTYNPVWNSVAMLNTSDGSGGYVFMGSRTVKSDGSLDVITEKSEGKYQYYFLKTDHNNVQFAKMPYESASQQYATDDEMYEIKDVNFKVTTPFYGTDGDDAAHTLTASIKLSKYSIEHENIVLADIPVELKRKYCDFTHFYKDATHTQEITKYSQLGEGPYDIYLGYDVSDNIPFKAITPATSYTADTWSAATWYELTDEGSIQENGKKLKYNGANFKNNGANGDYTKTSEFAFIGDPYELRVVYRDATSGYTPSYVGAAGETPTTETALTASTSATAGYKWQIPYDATSGSFLLQLYDGTGHWSWDASHLSESYSYTSESHTHDFSVPNGNAQSITFSISDLTYVNGHYIKVTAGGTDAAQVTSTTPTLSTGKGSVRIDGTATITVNLAANTSGSNKTFTLTIQEYDGSNDTTIGTATVITVTQAGIAFAGDAVEYSTSSSTRIKLMELPKFTYTYKIVDLAGRIAVKASVEETIFSPLSLASIPSIIVSPFLYGETLTFYDTYSGDSRQNFNPSNIITETPNTNNAEIFVKYTTAQLRYRTVKINQDQFFNVKLNGEYLYCEKVGEDVVIKTNANPSIDDLSTNAYLWLLRNRDPYDMLIDNLEARTILNVSGTEHVYVYNDDGASVTDEGTAATTDPETRPERNKGAWVRVDGGTWGNDKALTFVTDRDNASRFIAKSSLNQGVYEVMATTGDDVDAKTTYYNIGRSAANTVKIYSNASYAHGNDVLAFRLEQSTAYIYHLIDMDKHDLLQIPSKNPDLVLPAEYQSPLVDTYHYYRHSNMTISGGTYEPTNPATELTDMYGLDAIYDTPVLGDYSSIWTTKAGTVYQQTALDYDDMIAKTKKMTSTGNYYFKINTDYYYVNVTTAFDENIYVTYEKNDLVTFNDNSSPYLLKFLNPYADGYYLEDGNDKLTTSRIQAVYPYTNGDGNLNIYGQAMNEEQMNGGSSTRPRWVWFFDSENNDPYHVKIHSKSTISYNSIAHPTYLQTYAVHFNQDADDDIQHIVTSGVLAGIASVHPTEYMVLGTEGHYKLLTTQPIAADLNGDGDTDDTVEGVKENERRYVTSFEQYWKTYNMLKLYILDINKNTDAFSNDASTWVVPTTDDPSTGSVDEGTYRTTLAARGWHSYDAIANATRWNGYNDKSDGHEKKVVEKLEHWYQTFNMGDGSFDIISANIPPVLVLLDRHGWEIMRKPLPPSATYPYGEELEELRAYDSPMVKEYKFYSNATKATGCHKYTLRMQNGAERDQIKVNGKHYTSTSLGSLPPASASGVKSSGTFNDQFVTYTVKEEYEDSYKYHLELHDEDQTFTETGEASKFLVITNGRFYRDNADASKPNYLSKPIRQGSAVSGDNGEVYDMILMPTTIYADTNGDGKIDDNNLWYVQPNLNIDKEMGIKWAEAAGGTGEPLTEYETKKTYKEKTGFDPYNIQLKHASDKKYLTSHITTTALSSGAMAGDYTGGSNQVTLETWVDVKDRNTVNPTIVGGVTVNEGHDHTNLQMTNQTFMAVSDANGNMQLMPRFDHSKRITLDANAPYLSTLENSENHTVASVDNWRSMGPQTSFLVRPQIFEYHIIDNEGLESLRYKTAGEYFPSIPDHFRSPLATDFKYYFDHAAQKTAASSRESYTAAATANYFKKEAASAAAMETAAKALTVADDYYFQIGASAPYTYKKVTVTKAHSGTVDATYTTSDCTETEWTNAVAYQQSSTDEVDFVSDAKVIANKGLHYFQIGPTTLYRKVTVSGETKTTEESNSTDWESHSGSTSTTVADMTAYKTAVDALSANGTYYYKITSYYSYKKVIVTNTNGNFSAEVANNEDISSREITGTFAEAGLNDLTNDVYVRYSYNASADDDEILQGKWLTIKLANKDVQADGTLITTEGSTQGTGVSLYGTTKPADAATLSTSRQWQWKFLASPVDPSSDYYGTLDPYAVRIYNREKNYSTDMSIIPNPMGVGIKVNGSERFAVLSHPDGGYALAVAKEYPNYDYSFLNGADMTTPTTTAATTYPENRQKLTVADEAAYTAAVAALTADGEYYYKYSNGGDVYKKVVVISGAKTETSSNSSEWSNGDRYYFTIKASALSPGTQLVVNDDVEHNYTYKVINNGSSLAVNGTQTKAEAELHSYTPYLPDDIQTPLLNLSDYLYYGGANNVSDTYTVIPETHLITLYGLYDDVVYVRYNPYSMDKTEYKVPNKKDVVAGKVARHDESKDVALNINGGLPYNIIWENDNIMTREGTTISDGGSHSLDGSGQYIWRLFGDDPYAIQIRHNSDGKYVDGTATLNATAKNFMLLKKEGYDYGVLQETGGTNMLSGYGQTLEASDATHPTKFIIFGLSTHKVIYHLVIAETCPNKEASPLPTAQYVDIPYRTGTEASPSATLTTERIYGTSQRDLTSSVFGVPGDRYQLGTTIMGQTYCVDAGQVSVGDELKIPNEFNRPNTVYFFYVDNIQTGGATTTYQKTVASESDMNTDVASLSAVGNYYYKIENQYIYRKVHVVSVSPAVYEISGCSETEYTNSGSLLTAATESAMITAADAIAAVGDYYYKVGQIDLYKRVQVTAVSPVVSSTVDCTDDDWTNVWQDNATLNNRYKGLKITRLMSDAELIGSAVKINIAYAFQTGLETNAGEGFVTSTDQNLWYTFETQSGATPYLAHYTNAWGLQSMAGRETHYTNDYLWTPLGDVYGFKMYNRYSIKNSGVVGSVMTMPTITEGTNLKMAVPGEDGIPVGNEVFELLGSNTLGYFRVHPVINNIGTQYYVKRHDADTDINGDGNSDLDYAVISTSYSEWTFNMNPELLQPYIERKGYVGGLKETKYTENKTVLDKVMNGTASYPEMLVVQGIVYNDANIIKYAPGYYRIHNQPGVSSISPIRYASGYLHDIEKTAGTGSTAIPMHFYSKQGTSTTFGTEGLKNGYTETNATRGDIPVPATEYDPSTIFYFDGAALTPEQIEAGIVPTSKISTQGLYVKGNATDDNHGDAVMTATSGEATTFSLIDIGGAVFQIHDGNTPKKYLHYSQDYKKTIGGNEVNMIYDLKFSRKSPVDAVKWCIQPANNQGLVVATNKGGDDYYYTTFYAPFDVLLPANVEEDEDKGITAKEYNAYICESWNNKALTPIKVPESGSHAAGKFVPAGTPVIIRTSDESGSIKLTIPTNEPTTPATPKLGCAFSGEYLEQLLALDASHDVYTLGLPFTSDVSKDTDYNTTGEITAPLPEQAKSGIGFYINATPNKEADKSQSLWLRNNRYVLHNKIYYRAGGSGASARQNDMTGIEFVPVLFDGEELPDPNFQEQVTRTYPTGVFDLQGRKVATEEEVQDGTWRQQLSPGIYIVNGKKVAVK